MKTAEESDPLLFRRGGIRRRSPNMSQNEGDAYQAIDAESDHHQQQQQYSMQSYNIRQDEETPPLLEIPEEIYAVRKAALQVLKPLNKTWVCYYYIAERTTSPNTFPGGDIGGIFTHGIIRYGTVDAFTAPNALLVYCAALLVISHWTALAARSLRKSAFQFHFGSK